MKVTEEDCLTCGACCFFGKRFTGKSWKRIEVGEDGWCIHYNNEKKCMIHEDKPQVCKDFEIGCPQCIEMFKIINSK